MANFSFKHAFVALLLLLGSSSLMAQQSSNTIDYKVTYDQATATYTVWLVPNYDVPNANNPLNPVSNPDGIERGATAQVTIAVPKDFVITNVTDITGVWDKKNLFKLGPGQPNQDWSAASLNPNVNYYVIGKTPLETNYGSIKSGVDVPLFTFQGATCLGIVRIIEPNEPFINAADTIYSLNVANSFYSRSGQPVGRDPNPLEQFRRVAGTSARCSVNPLILIANSDTQTTASDKSVDTFVLYNDTKDGGSVPISDVDLTISVPPTKGTVTVNADGTIRYTPNPGTMGTDIYTYKICDKSQPSVCAEASVIITITPPGNTADLSVIKTATKSSVTINEEFFFQITVKNNGQVAATNVKVRDQLPAGLMYVSGADSQENGVSVWNMPTLPAGSSINLSIRVKVVERGVLYNTAVVQTADQTDPDLSNNSSTACVSVPVLLCEGESLELSAKGTSVVEWYRNDVLVTTANKFIVTQSGSYSNKSPNSTCLTNNCCPVVVITEKCCPADICIPFTIEKVK